ncbi:MAG: serine protease [Planctomycetes bacterium]|nr:serine protease [Planctomycetota bacterium]
MSVPASLRLARASIAATLLIVGTGRAAQEAEPPPGSNRVDGPATLDLARRVELRNRLSISAARICPNVVQLSIERRVGDGVVFSVEASGMVVDRAGHVVTIGSALEQAGRVAVHFQGASELRPRRARVVGVDEATDVGVLWIGPVELPPLEFAIEPAAQTAPEAAGADGRYVVTIFGAAEREAGPFALGFLQEPLKNPMLGRRRFAQLLSVTLVRTPQSAGGVIAGQDGRVAGLLLAPPASEAVTPAPMLALPATALWQGFEAVMVADRAVVATAEGAQLNVLAAGVEPLAGRPWLGFGARDIVEPEFLAQLDRKSAIVVTDVFDASPALAASIEPHDLILAWNGEPLTAVEQLTERIAKTAAGTCIELECLRRLERRKVKVTLGAW